MTTLEEKFALLKQYIEELQLSENVELLTIKCYGDRYDTWVAISYEDDNKEVHTKEL